MQTNSGHAELKRMLAQSRRAVVFTGAGISTESGIPDFRSPGGIWTKMSPIYFDEFLASEEARRETWRRRFAMEDIFKAAEPNRGHRAVDALVRRGKVSSVITQNIDGLHQRAGTPPGRARTAVRRGEHTSAIVHGRCAERQILRMACLSLALI